MTTKATRDVVDFVTRPVLAGTFIGITVDNSPIGQTTPNVGFFTNATAVNLIATGRLNLTGATLIGLPGTIAVTNAVNVFTKSQGGPFGTLTDASTIAWNARNIQVGTVTLGGNRTLGNPTGLTAGQTYIVIVKQPSSGGPRTLAYGSRYKWPGGTVPTLSTAANAVDILTFITDGTLMYGVAQQAFA